MEPASGIVTNEWQQSVADNQQPEVQIYCIYMANPFHLAEAANSTRWLKDGRLLGTSDERLTAAVTPTTGYPTLTIKRPNRGDAGNYQCQLTNSIGTSELLPPAESCRVQVNFRPSVRLRAMREVEEDDEGAAGRKEQSLNEEEELSEEELVLAGDSFELSCQVLEAQPNKVGKYYWFAAAGKGGERRLVGVSERPQFRLAKLAANFTATSFWCAAENSLGQSDLSNQVDIQLSYVPGKSSSAFFCVCVQLSPCVFVLRAFAAAAPRDEIQFRRSIGRRRRRATSRKRLSAQTTIGRLHNRPLNLI